jgi:hypothetical protein
VWFVNRVCGKLGCKWTYAIIDAAGWRVMTGNVGLWVSNALQWTEAFDRACVVIFVTAD